MKPLLIQYSTIASRNTEPFRWQAAGMGYAIRSSAGRFVVVDGGHPADAEPLITLLERYAEGVPEIDLWILTHPHIDHYGAAWELTRRPELAHRVSINSFLSCMPPRAFAEDQKSMALIDLDRATEVAKLLGVREISAVTGEIYRTDDVETEILLTFDDLEHASDPNESSMIFRVRVAGQCILFLGDTYSAPSRLLAARMGAELKCDFCQLAHHALNGGADELYAQADPRVALIPMARPAYEAMRFGEYRESRGTRHNRHVMEKLPESAQWLSADGDKVAELPYQFVERA